jgi:hypothetical protein
MVSRVNGGDAVMMALEVQRGRRYNPVEMLKGGQRVIIVWRVGSLAMRGSRAGSSQSHGLFKGRSCSIGSHQISRNPHGITGATGLLGSGRGRDECRHAQCRERSGLLKKSTSVHTPSLFLHRHLLAWLSLGQSDPTIVSIQPPRAQLTLDS